MRLCLLSLLALFTLIKEFNSIMLAAMSQETNAIFASQAKMLYKGAPTTFNSCCDPILQRHSLHTRTQGEYASVRGNAIQLFLLAINLGWIIITRWCVNFLKTRWSDIFAFLFLSSVYFHQNTRKTGGGCESKEIGKGRGVHEFIDSFPHLSTCCQNFLPIFDTKALTFNLHIKLYA